MSVNPSARNALEHFREFRWIFTGTGRCGTGYVSKVLQSAGVRCGHEDVFNRSGWNDAAHKMRYGHWEADASWLAAPWLARVREEFPEVKIIHLLRHPRDVIASWLSNGVFDGAFRPWLKWAMRFLPELPDGDELDVAAWYFCEWTKKVIPHADHDWRVEDGLPLLLGALGIDHVGKKLFSDTRYNHRAEIARVPDLRELREPWRSAILEWCGEWGYETDSRLGLEGSEASSGSKLGLQAERETSALCGPRRESEPIRGWLCADHPVMLHPETAKIGGSFQARVDRQDSGISEPLAWDNGLVRFFHEQLCKFEREREGPYLFVDVGASTGCFSLLAYYHPQMLVYAYEPNSRPHRVLKANVALNGLTNRVSTFDFALGEVGGRVRLQVPKDPKWLAVATTARPEMVRKRGLEWAESRRKHPGYCVDMVRLDQVLLFSAVDFMKVDVEGAELMVLRGARAVLERDHPKLLVEFQELNTRQFGYEPQEITAFLEEVGYTKFRRVGVEDLWVEA